MIRRWLRGCEESSGLLCRRWLLEQASRGGLSCRRPEWSARCRLREEPTLSWCTGRGAEQAYAATEWGLLGRLRCEETSSSSGTWVRSRRSEKSAGWLCSLRRFLWLREEGSLLTTSWCLRCGAKETSWGRLLSGLSWCAEEASRFLLGLGSWISSE